MNSSALLSQPHLSFITREADHELARIQDLVEHKVLVEGRGEFEEALGRLLHCGARPAPKTLDLIGLSTAAASLLWLGDWVIDASSAIVTAFFRELADHQVLARLGVHSVRLLGCQTAHSALGRTTLCRLSDLLGVEVYGTTRLLHAAHYDRAGFRDDAEHMLVGSSQLRRGHVERGAEREGKPYPRMLDLDALPATTLLPSQRRWPCRVASTQATRDILQLVRRHEGAQLAGLLAAPSCEIAIPARTGYHFVQVLLDGEFLRVYPDGPLSPGVVFPVDDPHALRALLDRLPSTGERAHGARRRVVVTGRRTA